jgi:hypothetical protein
MATAIIPGVWTGGDTPMEKQNGVAQYDPGDILSCLGMEFFTECANDQILRPL